MKEICEKCCGKIQKTRFGCGEKICFFCKMTMKWPGKCAGNGRNAVKAKIERSIKLCTNRRYKLIAPILQTCGRKCNRFILQYGSKGLFFFACIYNSAYAVCFFCRIAPINIFRRLDVTVTACNPSFAQPISVVFRFSASVYTKDVGKSSIEKQRRFLNPLRKMFFLNEGDILKWRSICEGGEFSIASRRDIPYFNRCTSEGGKSIDVFLNANRNVYSAPLLHMNLAYLYITCAFSKCARRQNSNTSTQWRGTKRPALANAPCFRGSRGMPRRSYRILYFNRRSGE